MWTRVLECLVLGRLDSRFRALAHEGRFCLGFNDPEVLAAEAARIGLLGSEDRVAAITSSGRALQEIDQAVLKEHMAGIRRINLRTAHAGVQLHPRLWTRTLGHLQIALRAMMVSDLAARQVTSAVSSLREFVVREPARPAEGPAGQLGPELSGPASTPLRDLGFVAAPRPDPARVHALAVRVVEQIRVDPLFATARRAGAPAPDAERYARAILARARGAPPAAEREAECGGDLDVRPAQRERETAAILRFAEEAAKDLGIREKNTLAAVRTVLPEMTPGDSLRPNVGAWRADGAV